MDQNISISLGTISRPPSVHSVDMCQVRILLQVVVCTFPQRLCGVGVVGCVSVCAGICIAVSNWALINAWQPRKYLFNEEN